MSKSVVPHDLSWKERFSAEREAVRLALGENAVAIHHIGSTAIPDILAKPIIDILVEVLKLDEVDLHASDMAIIGYENMGAYDIDGRRYFRKENADGVRTHHVHVFVRGSNHIARHIAFRDFLLAHPCKAKEYSDLKAALIVGADICWNDYQQGKSGFIQATEREANKWFQSNK